MCCKGRIQESFEPLVEQPKWRAKVILWHTYGQHHSFDCLEDSKIEGFHDFILCFQSICKYKQISAYLSNFDWKVIHIHLPLQRLSVGQWCSQLFHIIHCFIMEQICMFFILLWMVHHLITIDVSKNIFILIKPIITLSHS